MKTTLMSAIAALGLVTAAVGCDRTADTPREDTSVLDDTRDATGTGGDEARPGMPRVADIVGNPDNYAGQTVTVEADVQKVLGPRAFLLDEDSPLAGGIDNDLLVIGRQTSNLEAIDNDWMNNKVRVSGTVGRMTVVEVEREAGWDLTPEIEAEVEGAEAVLFANSVTRIQ